MASTQESPTDKGDLTGTISVWDAANGTKRSVIAGGEIVDDRNGWGFALGVRFSPDGKYLVAPWADQVNVWDASTGSLALHLKLEPIRPGQGSYGFHGFTPDSKHVAVCTSKGEQDRPQITFWEINSGNQLGMVEGHQVEFSPSSSIGATWSTSPPRIMLWDFSDLRKPNLIRELKSFDGITAISKDLAKLCIIGERFDNSMREVSLFETATGKKLESFKYLSIVPKHQMGFFLIRASLSLAGRVTIIECEDMNAWGKQQIVMSNWQSAPSVIDLGSEGEKSFSYASADGEWVYRTHESGALIYDVERMELHADLVCHGNVESFPKKHQFYWKSNAHCSFSERGGRMAVTNTVAQDLGYPVSQLLPNKFNFFPSTACKSVRVWDVEKKASLLACTDAEALAFSEDGNSLVTGHEGGIVKIWDLPPAKNWPVIIAAATLLWLVVVSAGRCLLFLMRFAGRGLPRQRRI